MAKRTIDNRTCPHCNSVDLKRRGSGIENHADTQIYCQNCGADLDFKELGPRKENNPRDDVKSTSIAGKLDKMHPDEL
jgi:transcription elongation factor Elf1